MPIALAAKAAPAALSAVSSLLSISKNLGGDKSAQQGAEAPADNKAIDNPLKLAMSKLGLGDNK